MTWNDTWIDLPTLPDFTYHDGTVWPMTDTLLMSLDTAGSVNSLHLVGGENRDWSTGVQTVTWKVWELQFNRGKPHYHWDDGLDHEMGKCGLWHSHVVIILFVRYDYGQ